MTTRLERIHQLVEIRDRALEGVRSPLAQNFQGLNESNLDMVAARAEKRLRVLWHEENADKEDKS